MTLKGISAGYRDHVMVQCTINCNSDKVQHSSVTGNWITVHVWNTDRTSSYSTHLNCTFDTYSVMLPVYYYITEDWYGDSLQVQTVQVTPLKRTLASSP